MFAMGILTSNTIQAYILKTSKKLIYTKGGQTLAQVAQRYRGVSVLGDI